MNCYPRLPLLKTARARDLFVQGLGRVRNEMGFRLVGFVVMPEHVHLLIREESLNDRPKRDSSHKSRAMQNRPSLRRLRSE